MIGPYDDMIHLPHHVSLQHPHMSLIDRATQFSPFAALTGYDAAIQETARLTDTQAELDEDARILLDQKQQILLEHLADRPAVTITYFDPDKRKCGGRYVTVTGNLQKIDSYAHALVLTDGARIPLDRIVDLQSQLFSSTFL